MATTIVEIVLLLLAHSLAGIYSSTLKYSKRTTYIIWGTWAVVQGSLFLVCEFLLTQVPLQFFAGFVIALVGQYVIFFLTTKGRLAERVFIILTYSIFFCIAMALFTMVKGSFTTVPPVLLALINAVILAGVLFYFLRYVCSLCRRAVKSIESGWAPLIFVNIVFLITVVLSSVFPQRLMSFYDPAFITFIFLCVSIMAVYPVIFSNINSMSEAATKHEVEAQNRLLLAQIDAENAQIAADGQARHDRRHHNLVMLEFAKNDDIDSIREYLAQLIKSDVEVWGEVRHCENTTVNTVLTVYERRAVENGIRVNISAQVSSAINILPQDLVIVIANLFENAIHATSKLKSKNACIDITIRENAQRLLVKVENSCKEKMSFDRSLYGIGIQSVISTVGKYDGMYDFTAEDGIFSAKLSLNLK